MLGERKKKNRESNVKDILKPERCAITETPKSVFDFNTIFSIVAIKWLLAAGENNGNNNIINGLNCILHTFSLCLHKNLNWDWLQNTLRFISVQFLFVHTIHWPSLQIVLDFGQEKCSHKKPHYETKIKLYGQQCCGCSFQRIFSQWNFKCAFPPGPSTTKKTIDWTSDQMDFLLFRAKFSWF